MKPNGRRRWRGIERKQKYRIRKLGLTPASISLRLHPMWGRRHPVPLQRKWMDDALPRLTFTARSLCGVSQGARKRRALDVSVTRCGPEYAAHRAAFRVGERLRPCPGCAKCRTLCDRPIEACSLACKHRTFEYCGESGTHCDKHCLCPCHLCRKEHGPIPDCGGAMVMTARKARKAR